jgi:putative phosphoesterase
MKIAIVSDIHANLAALQAFPESDYDQLWCVGDLVDYGPRPREVIHEIQSRATVVVSGNHDYAAGFSADPRCSPPFRRLAAETLRYTQEVCSDEHLLVLRNLPQFREITIRGTRFYVAHATPSDPLFAYSPEGSERWTREVELIEADVLIVGHTHTPFVRVVGNTTIVNPGSLGQPKTGRPLACYAVWEDGVVSLKEYEYPIAETIRDIRGMPITEADQDALISVLKTGMLPAKRTGSSGLAPEATVRSDP